MYFAPYTRVEDEAVLLAHLERHSFTTIMAAPGGRPVVSHAPVVVRRLERGLALDFHLARANALTPLFAEGLRAVAVSLAVDGYISPDWYESPDQVPTWNYVTVEAEGPLRLLAEDELVAQLDDLSAQEEARLLPKPPWTRGKMDPKRFEALLRALVGLRLTVERLEGTFKLSQNKNAADYSGVLAGLGDHPLAAWMRRG